MNPEFNFIPNNAAATSCVFCKIIAGEIPAAKVYESDHVIAFLDVNPIEKGHTLVVPKCHWESLLDTPVGDEADIECLEELMYIVRVTAKAVCNAFADGANILQANGVCAGQTVNHLHFHVIPRNGEQPPPCAEAWTSGAGQYSSEDERNEYVHKIKLAIQQIVDEEDLI